MSVFEGVLESAIATPNIVLYTVANQLLSDANYVLVFGVVWSKFGMKAF